MIVLDIFSSSDHFEKFCFKAVCYFLNSLFGGQSFVSNFKLKIIYKNVLLFRIHGKTTGFHIEMSQKECGVLIRFSDLISDWCTTPLNFLKY